MIFEIVCLVFGIGLAVTGSLTFWPVHSGWDFYIPIVLFLAGYLFGLFGIVWNWVGISGKIMMARKKPRLKPNSYARWLLVEGVTYITNHAHIKVEIRGINKMPKRQRYLLVCNHRSMFDNFIISRVLGTKHELAFISKPSNMKVPLTKGVSYPQGYMTINREDKLQSLEVMKKATEYLANDFSSVCIFPEGTRQKNLELGEFHEGIFNVALHSHSPIVVLTLSGTQQVHKRWPWRITKVRFDVLCTLPYEEIAHMPAKEVSDMIHDMMAQHLKLIETRKK